MTDATVSEGPLAAYRARRYAGELKPDPGQELTVEKLQSLANALRYYELSTGPGGWKARLGLARRRADPPQGLYIYGGVGTGKSMLMDLFFETAPIEVKRRVHFHAFMQEVHDRLHAWRRRTKGAKADPLPELAGELSEEAWLICFDEFHVVNIADAMILGRLFDSLFERGVVVVATSNWPPDRLYDGGLQRERFLPFVALLKERLDILQLDSGRDYRMARLQDISVYHAPLGARAAAAMEQAFTRLTEGAAGAPDRITVKGRTLAVPRAARGVACFSFAELCEAPLGAGDYLAIAGRYHAVILADVPVLNTDRRNEARRFMTLIDALYEHRVKLVVSAEVPPERLYPTGDGAAEFQRTVSRLQEMRSKEYIALEHSD
ncbi:MAG: cell division protein ZapE [Rhodospirillales bacterium]|nr:cell division protein ZapE [Rhodospirillales bacterium]MDH3912576.1 cell division protein ZapE [Rhodospirillales bacterium]MDH3918598.1 cell division protein ZapE [Rhodospirillales bacterium]MDH3968139.1 cell division protein ZapE [Rhodospirillales bacterium]